MSWGPAAARASAGAGVSEGGLARTVWWVFLRRSQVEQPRPQGGAWRTPWQGHWLDSCKTDKTPVLCHTLIASIFCLLSSVLFYLIWVVFLWF